MDELAHECGADPLEFRLKHLSDERVRAGLEAAAEKAGWGADREEGHGRGIAVARIQKTSRLGDGAMRRYAGAQRRDDSCERVRRLFRKKLLRYR